MSLFRFFSLSLAVALLLAAPVQASSRSSQSSGVSQDYVTIIENRLQALEEQVQRLTNQVEQANYQAQQAQTRLQRVEEDMNTRFRMLEGQQGAASAEAPIIHDSPAQTPPKDDEQRLGQLTTGENGDSVDLPDNANTAYDMAFSKIRDGDYEAAESAMRAFIQKYPRHDLASNASYWLGESFYVRGDYEHAAKSFAESYQKYPRGAKAEDTLIKLGLTLSALNRTNDACVTLEQAVKEFPRMSASNHRRIDQERKQMDCPSSGGSGR